MKDKYHWWDVMEEITEGNASVDPKNSPYVNSFDSLDKSARSPSGSAPVSASAIAIEGSDATSSGSDAENAPEPKTKKPKNLKKKKER